MQKTRSDLSEMCSSTATQANWKISILLRQPPRQDSTFILPLRYSVQAPKLLSLHLFLNFKVGIQLEMTTSHCISSLKVSEENLKLVLTFHCKDEVKPHFEVDTVRGPKLGARGSKPWKSHNVGFHLSC